MENKQVLICLKYFAGSWILRRIQTTYFLCGIWEASQYVSTWLSNFVSISPICPIFYLLCHTNFGSDSLFYTTERWGWAKNIGTDDKITPEKCFLGRWQLAIYLQMSWMTLRMHINFNEQLKQKQKSSEITFLDNGSV